MGNLKQASPLSIAWMDIAREKTDVRTNANFCQQVSRR